MPIIFEVHAHLCYHLLLIFFCHHLPTSWPFLMFLENVGSWLTTFLSSVSFSIISKLFALPVSKLHCPFTWSFLGNFASSSCQLSWALSFPRWRFWNLELGESPLGTHRVLPSSHLFSSRGPCSLGTWVFFDFLLPPSSFLTPVDSTGSHVTAILPASWFPLYELAP